MKFSFFYHSLESDWSHGSAHFLRGVVAELLSRGHEVQVFEPDDSWSRENLLSDHGAAALNAFYDAYPGLSSRAYSRSNLDMERVAEESDVVLVHEWNEPWLVNGFGELRNRLQAGGNHDLDFCLLFHDTHHRAISDPSWLHRFRLDYYDGVLAFGEVLSDLYRKNGWTQNVWTWHEAADTRVFYPREPNPDLPSGELVWVGNWGDDERAAELEKFFFKPVHELQLHSHVYGVRYPRAILQKFALEGIHYCGWLPNFRVPEIFANHRVTLHVPRRYYVSSLPGVPTIRPFEAMACGIPLVSAPWDDNEGLFTAGVDYLLAKDGQQMRRHLHALLHDGDLALAQSEQALKTIRTRHTCAHRVDQLLTILDQLNPVHPHMNSAGEIRLHA
jgi:spore maturation protein CgeB